MRSGFLTLNRIGHDEGIGVTQRKQLGRFGAVEAISIQAVVRNNGESAVRVQVDFSQIDAPDAYYVADYARVEVSGSTVEMLFGKLDGHSNKLRNKLEVRIPAYAFLGQWMASMPFIDSLKESMDEKGFPVYLTPADIDEQTEKTQTVHANNTLISGGESECCIDLYFLPPRDLRFYLEKNSAPRLEPLVRIITEGRLLVGLGQVFREIADQVRKYAPAVEELENVNELEVTT